ncbi:Probable E3 ubiquitin-protein ligase HERC2 [Gryllus bimaculatus]|nr:Probable E3 ubiquitin-protein ligase HERC2 [Gryllus bimaculatus]
MPSAAAAAPTDSALLALVQALPQALLRQHEYEDPAVRGGKHLMHSDFFKVLVALACDLGLDSLPCCSENHKWSWFRRYCMAARVASALVNRTALPHSFCVEVRKKILEIAPDSDGQGWEHENHQLFRQEHDEQLLMWLHSWSGSGTIYGWGHNHRGQLGGVEGAKVKLPTPCEALSALRPVQLAGGEQTLVAVTADGKVYATGYGAGGRLGVGGTDSVLSPTLLESIQHVFIKKVAVNSGGKHCLALSAEGEVYSWGEGDDGKLGHGNRSSCERPRVIEALRGKEVIDIACGGAHSAAITHGRELYTWGKGRYGRLGHGDSEDQLRPKLVEALLGYQVVDVACGSGDAQTLCITDDDNVWSWGDGDYGKLGRGGSDGCKIPLKIESLAGLGVIKVECGSQFSVALTRSGSVYTWGKGDYHRLGHGTDDHVRRPRKVAALQGKKIVCIATGSLHCVACSDQGEVFTWGDNDEGQLGDGSTNAIQRPRLVVALQAKKITQVACGSAHTLAWSTNKPASASRLPAGAPLEYDLVRDLPLPLLRNRLVLLHHFSELFCPSVAMFPMDGEGGLDRLRGILVSSTKEATFRKVVQATMVRDRQHGPVIELNRIQVKRSRSKGGLAGPDGMKSVFGQMVAKLPLLSPDTLFLPHRVWKVKFVGESVDDCGGGYSESITEMCEELQNGSLPLLISTPNGRDEAGTNRDCFLLNPALKSPLHMNMFRFLGVLMGIAIRTGSPLSLSLAEPVWKQLAGLPLTPADLTEVDRDYVPGLLCIRDMEPDAKAFSALEMPFSSPSACGAEVPLSTRYKRITPENRLEYVRYELETMVCGSPDIPLNLLKSVATYKVMEEFSNQERSLFLRFVWGRTRLPRTIADFRGRDFVLQVLDKYSPPDHFLPESYTCFFLLKMPRYSCKAVLREKLKYAIHFCKSIDTDEYARVAMPSSGGASSNCDSDDVDSIASDGPALELSAKCGWPTLEDCEQINSYFRLVCDRAILLPTLQTVVPAGKLFGSLFMGWFSDGLGRKPGFIISSSFYMLAAAIPFMFQDYIGLCIGRFLMGIGGTGCFYSGLTLSVEVASLKWRSILGVLFNISYALGMVTLPLLSMFITQWRQLLLAVTMPIYLLFDEEKTGEKLTCEDVKRKIVKILKLISNFCVHSELIFRLMAMIHIFNVVNGVMEAIGYSTPILLLKWFPRRLLGFGLLMIAGSALIITIPIPRDIYWSSMLELVIIMIIRVTNSGVFAVIIVLTAELFPTEERATALGICSATSHVAGMISSFLVGYESGPLGKNFAILLCGIATIGIAIIILLVPETKGKPLMDTIEDLEEKVKEGDRISCVNLVRFKWRPQE